MATPTKKSRNSTPVNASDDNSEDEKRLKRFLEQLFAFIEKQEGQHANSGIVPTGAQALEGAGGTALPYSALAKPREPMSEAILEKAIKRVEQEFHAAPWDVTRVEENMRRAYRPGTGQTALDFALALDRIEHSPEEREKRVAYYATHTEYCAPLDTPKPSKDPSLSPPHH